METIINKKDEVICKLNEEIQYIKTKLLSLERGGAQNDLATKGRGLINASNEIPNNSKNKDPSQDNVSNIMDDSFGFTNELPTIMNKSQLSTTIIEIPPSNDEDQHENLTNATVIVDQLTSLLLAYTKDAPPSKQQAPPAYPMITWSTYLWPKPLMDIPIYSPCIVHQPIYLLHLRPPVY